MDITVAVVHQETDDLREFLLHLNSLMMNLEEHFKNVDVFCTFKSLEAFYDSEVQDLCRSLSFRYPSFHKSYVDVRCKPEVTFEDAAGRHPDGLMLFLGERGSWYNIDWPEIFREYDLDNENSCWLIYDSVNSGHKEIKAAFLNCQGKDKIVDAATANSETELYMHLAGLFGVVGQSWRCNGLKSTFELYPVTVGAFRFSEKRRMNRFLHRCEELFPEDIQAYFAVKPVFRDSRYD